MEGRCPPCRAARSQPRRSALRSRYRKCTSRRWRWGCSSLWSRLGRSSPPPAFFGVTWCWAAEEGVEPGAPHGEGSPTRIAASIPTPPWPPRARQAEPRAMGERPSCLGSPRCPPCKEGAGPRGLPSPQRAAARIRTQKGTWTPNLSPPRKRVLDPFLLQREPRQGNAADARCFPEHPHCIQRGPAPGCCPTALWGLTGAARWGKQRLEMWTSARANARAVSAVFPLSSAAKGEPAAAQSLQAAQAPCSSQNP